MIHNVCRMDAIEFLRTLDESSIDLVVTDPAYNGMNQHLSLGKGRIVGEYNQRGDGEKWFSEFDDNETNYRLFLHECHRVLKTSGSIFLMFDPYSLITLGQLLREYFSVKNLITWDKMAIGMGHNFRRQTEFIMYATKGKAKLVRRDVSDVWRIKRVHKPEYPTQKPVELFEAMIASTIGHNSSPSITVCDPFMGSGSSAVATIRQGCSYAGSDIAESAISITNQRIQAALAGMQDPYQSKNLVDSSLQKPFWLETRMPIGTLPIS